MLHHVGVATPDAAALAATYGDLLALGVAHEEQLADRNLSVTFLGDGPYVELLEPTGPGPVQRFLDREGPGLHHLAVSVADPAVAATRAREQGLEPIGDGPRPGAWGHEVVFLRPGDAGGVLLELVG